MGASTISPLYLKGSATVWRGGRVAEGGGLLNRYTVKSCIGGSNPPLSARHFRTPDHAPAYAGSPQRLHPADAARLGWCPDGVRQGFWGRLVRGARLELQGQQLELGCVGVG